MEAILQEIEGTLTAEDWVLPILFGAVGVCVGSFLNVVIYRLPRGMRVNEPQRSFCPRCGAAIPWYRNLPIISWLLLRGKGACCGGRISLQYPLVELGTALLFFCTALHLEGETAWTIAAVCVWMAAMITLFCIDCLHMIVPVRVVLVATAAGVAAALSAPWLLATPCWESTEGLFRSAVGAATGYALLRGVALLGRALFGHNRRQYPTPQEWHLRENTEGTDLLLSIGEDTLTWSELFREESDRLHLTTATLHGRNIAPGELCFSPERLRLPDGSHLRLEDYTELRGTCTGYASRREAMGSGDAWIALAIGSLLGWQGVLFMLPASTIPALLWALVTRTGRGVPLPYGPWLITAALAWFFYGPEITSFYIDHCLTP